MPIPSLKTPQNVTSQNSNTTNKPTIIPSPSSPSVSNISLNPNPTVKNSTNKTAPQNIIPAPLKGDTNIKAGIESPTGTSIKQAALITTPVKSQPAVKTIVSN